MQNKEETVKKKRVRERARKKLKRKEERAKNN